MVHKAGQVIHEVLGVIREKRTGKEKAFKMPSKCPSCGEPVRKDEGKTAVRCVNMKCPGRIRENLFHFVSRKAMNIENIGESLIEQLVEKKLVLSAIDLYRLKEEELLGLERMGKILAKKIIKNIESSKKTAKEKFLYSLGIKNVGEHLADLLIKRFKTFDDLIKADYETLMGINEIGPEVARSIVEYFSESENKKMIKEFMNEGIEFKEDNSNEDQPLSGKTFLITGTLKKHSRAEAQNRIKEYGGNITESVSKKVDYLIVGESPGSKADKAKKIGIKIINEEEFESMIKKS